VEIDDASMIATSFPEFFDLMASLGAEIEAG
jgi:5-enolpyruvylshikimate-3-phosphate synthase